MVNNRSLHLRVAQHPRRRSFCHRIASQKDLAALLPEVRSIEITQIDTNIKRKTEKYRLTFQIFRSSSYAQVFYHFLFVAVLLKGEQRLLEKRKTTDFHANSNPLEDILTRHAMTSSYCFTHFQKWKSSGL